MDLEDVMAASGQIANYTRYNGGWIKTVTGLNTKTTDGYSILGEFVKDGIQWQDPGLYLDCSIGGSRKQQERWFTLFVLTPDGEIQKVGKWWKIPGSSGGTWAPHFWDEIERQLNALKAPAKPDPNKQFPVALISREYLATRFGEKAYDLTDEQMKQIAERSFTDYLGEALYDTVESALMYLGFKLEEDTTEAKQDDDEDIHGPE
jgi:hypothetical protein